MPRFQALLETETAQWNGALNTQERVKIKASAMIEEWLPEAHERMHDRGESLNAKTELGKLIRSTLPDGGKIAVFVGSMDAQNARERQQGMIDELAKP